MKLNLAKCVFVIASGKFLGFMVSQCGIESRGNHQGQITKNSERGSELDRKGCSSKQIRLQGNGQVHTTLQGLEKGLLVDWQMWKSLCKIKRVLDEATIAKSLGNGRKAVPLYNSVQHHNKFGTDQGRRKYLEVSLLYQLGIPRSKGKLPKDGKDSFRIGGRSQETLSLLPSTLHHHHVRPTNKKDNEQDRCSRMTHSMGNWAGPIRYRISALSSNQSLSTSRFHHWIHLPL